MRIRTLGGALVAIGAFAAVLAGQSPAPTVTPMPWEPANEATAAIRDRIDRTAPGSQERRALERALAVLDDPRAEPRDSTSLQTQDRLSVLAGLNECRLPDRTTRRVNAKVTFNGWSYLCVEVLNSQLVRQGVSWMRVAD